MKRLIAMLSTGLAIGFALALAYADDTTRTNNGSSDTTLSQPGIMATSTPGAPDTNSGTGMSPDMDMPGTMGTPGIGDESVFDQPGQTGSTTTTPGETSKGMDTTTRTKEQASKSTDSKTCTDQSGIIHRAGTEAYTKCLKEQSKTQKEMGGQTGESMDDMHKGTHESPDQGGTMGEDMSGESGEKSESSY